MTGENDLFTVLDGETSPHARSLSKVVGATFEKMGFMQSFVCQKRDEDINMLCATLVVEEPVTAKIYFSCPRTLSWSIAENLYGLEELSNEVVADMMTELLNTIAGSWLSHIMPNQTFTLSIPSCCEDTFHIDEDMHEYHFKIANAGVISIGLKKL